MKTTQDELNYLGAEFYVAASGLQALHSLFSTQLWLHRMDFKQHQKMWFNELTRHLARGKTLLDNMINETYGWTGEAVIESKDGQIKHEVTSFDVADALQTEGSQLARLILLWGNATYHHPENVIKIESMLKLMAKEPYFSTDLIESIKV